MRATARLDGQNLTVERLNRLGLKAEITYDAASARVQIASLQLSHAGSAPKKTNGTQPSNCSSKIWPHSLLATGRMDFLTIRDQTSIDVSLGRSILRTISSSALRRKL